MKEIKIQLRHAKIDAPLECTMKLNDEWFFIENHNFCPIQIHETLYIPVWNMYYGMMQKFCFEHRKEWWDFMKKNNFDPSDNKIYDLLRANNVRQWEQQRNKQQNQQK